MAHLLRRFFIVLGGVCSLSGGVMNNKAYTITTRTAHGSYTKTFLTHSREQAFALHAAELHHLGVSGQSSFVNITETRKAYQVGQEVTEDGRKGVVLGRIQDTGGAARFGWCLLMSDDSHAFVWE